MFKGDEVITSGNWQKFLTLNNEELLLVKRKHPYVTLPTIISVSLISILFVSFSFFFFVLVIKSIPIFLISTFIIVAITLTLIAKTINDWFFHLYILTNRKILEVSYAPLSSHVVNDVMLDKVNCTEIDIRRHGFLNELLDIGDVVMTFDRPTKREEFVLQNIQGCYKLGVFLTQKILDEAPIKSLPDAIWVRSSYGPVG